MNYVIRSKHTREYFRYTQRLTGEIVWWPESDKAAKFEDEGAARAAARAIGFGEKSIADHLEILPALEGHMRNDSPRYTLATPRKVTTAVRRLSQETLAECRRAGGVL